MARMNTLQELAEFRRRVLSKRDPNKGSISVCAGTGCLATGASRVVSAFRDEIESRGLTDAVELRGTGCHGFCEKGPIVVLGP